MRRWLSKVRNQEVFASFFLKKEDSSAFAKHIHFVAAVFARWNALETQPLINSKKGKLLFLKKKKQKDFCLWCCPGCSERANSSSTQNKSFFASFFQKKKMLLSCCRQPVWRRLHVPRGAKERGLNSLLVGTTAYLVALPFLPAQTAAVALVALAAAAVVQPDRGAWASSRPASFVFSVAPFLAAQILAAVRSPVPAQSTAVLSFFLPGLVLFFVIMDKISWPVQAGFRVWTAFCAVLSLSVVIGWMRLQLGAAVPIDADVPQAAIFLSGNQILLVPNDICAAAVGMAFPMATLVSPGARGLARAAALSSILLTVFAMAILRTRAGFAVTCIELLFFAVAWRPMLLLAFPAGFILLAAADFALRLHLIERLLFANTLQNHGIVGRLGLWDSALGMFSTARLLGHGAQSFGAEHMAFLPAWAPPFPERHVLWGA